MKVEVVAGGVTTNFVMLTEAVDYLLANGIVGATIRITDYVTGESAKVPGGTTVHVERDEYFREPAESDLRHPYYQFPVPCETNEEARIYSYAVNTNLVTPAIGTFVLQGDGEDRRAVITFDNGWAGLRYQPLVSETLGGFVPEGEEVVAVTNGPITVSAEAKGGVRFYRVEVRGLEVK